MGRKPNQLILEYFSRGAKLEDASNRYQHTCKSCGEHFPKGRIDSLTAHLTRKCPSLSHNERAAIVLRLHDLVDPSEIRSTVKSGTIMDTEKPVTLPYSPSKQNFNGLNVLAEASRRVGASDRPRIPAYVSAEQDQVLLVDPALEVDGFPHTFLEHVDDNLMSKSNDFHSTNAPSLPSLLPFLSPDGSNPQNASPHVPAMSLDESAVSTQPPDLSTIAASASEMLPTDVDLDMTSEAISAALFEGLNHVNPASDVHARNVAQPISPMETLARAKSISYDGPETRSGEIQPVLDRNAQTLRPIAMHPNSKPTHFVSESGTSAKALKPKVRGRFTFERRKEVQQIRKKGACIRCRMLKKSCSDKTPCDACSGVETPRMWKQPCVRTKLANEFTLFFVGLNSTLAFHELSNFKAQVSLTSFGGTIEAFHLESMSPMMTFKTLRTDPSFEMSNKQTLTSAEDTVFLIDSEQDDIPAKIESYLREARPRFWECEPTPFLKTTLALSAILADEKNDALLHKVLDLWVMTLVLSDTEIVWRFAVNPDSTLEAPKTPVVTNPQIRSSSTNSTQLNEASFPYSYSLITSQLRTTIDKKAALTSKSVMNELERRLLQRQQTYRFETFLIAVILLNCTERMCWLFRIWDYPGRLSRWPLDKKPGAYAEEGDQFAEMLHMLLEMRNLPPKTVLLSDGSIMAQNDESEPVRKWFQELGITEALLQHWDNVEFDPQNSRSLDGKFFGKILRS